jgi:hypothetical protein
MDNKILWLVIAAYLAVGVLVLVIFDLITKRIRRKIHDAATETSIRLITGKKTSMTVFVLTMWVFWPAVLYGAAEDKIRSKIRSIVKAVRK